MSNPSKNKGKVFEREIAKHLAEVFGLPFQRVPCSGSFIGGKNAYRADLITEEQKLLVDGDIIVPKELSHCSFECKWYKEFAWSKLIQTGEEAHLTRWIKQASETKKRLWFVIFKINRQGSFVCYPSETLCVLDWSEPPLGTHISVGDSSENKHHIVESLDGFFETHKNGILNSNVQFSK